MTWRPLLTGSLRTDALARVEEIRADLERAGTVGDDPSLSTGHAGIAVFFAHYARAHCGDEAAAARSVAHLERAIDVAQQRENGSLALFTGWCGIAWAAAAVGRCLEREVCGPLREELDEILAEALTHEPWRSPLDLVYGLSGWTVYLLDHPDRRIAMRLLPIVCESFQRASENDERGGITWRTQAVHLSRAAANRHPGGRLDLGMAHGVPGIAAALGRVAMEHDIGIARQLFGKALAWLRATTASSSPPGELGFFADEDRAARSAWCYGNPGVATALYTVAASHDETTRRWMLRMARLAANRPQEQTGVVDATFCHGSAGLGHLFNRLYQRSGDDCFAAAALSWYRETLASRHAGGCGGYMNWWPDDRTWHDDPGVLVGAAGIGLVLLAAASPTEPTWDSMFGLAPPCAVA